MKHLVIFSCFVIVIGAVAATGWWYVNESQRQYLYEQAANLDRNTVNRVDNSTVISDDQLQTDPFGLFGPSEVIYDITMKVEWSEQTHRDYHISTAHMSDPVIWVGKTNPVFSLGSSASPGMKEMAEDGRTRTIKQELEFLQTSGQIEQFHIYDRIDAPGTQTYRVYINRDNPVVSLVSMIAPSPDWFVAIEGLNLLEDGRWKNKISLVAIALDAGTEDGSEFKITNPATSPRGVISKLTDIPSVEIPPFVRVEFTRIGYTEN